MTRLTMREQNEALFMQEIKHCDLTKHKRMSGHCIGCLVAPQCPWCLEDW